MSKTKFNVLHKNTIVINGTKYRVNQLTKKQLEDPIIDTCMLCDCFNRKNEKDCINFMNNRINMIICSLTIGTNGYLSLIKHAKNKV